MCFLHNINYDKKPRGSWEINDNRGEAGKFVENVKNATKI